MKGQRGSCRSNDQGVCELSRSNLNPTQKTDRESVILRARLDHSCLKTARISILFHLLALLSIANVFSRWKRTVQHLQMLGRNQRKSREPRGHTETHWRITPVNTESHTGTSRTYKTGPFTTEYSKTHDSNTQLAHKRQILRSEQYNVL